MPRPRHKHGVAVDNIATESAGDCAYVHHVHITRTVTRLGHPWHHGLLLSLRADSHLFAVIANKWRNGKHANIIGITMTSLAARTRLVRPRSGHTSPPMQGRGGRGTLEWCVERFVALGVGVSLSTRALLRTGGGPRVPFQRHCAAVPLLPIRAGSFPMYPARLEASRSGRVFRSGLLSSSSPFVNRRPDYREGGCRQSDVHHSALE